MANIQIFMVLLAIFVYISQQRQSAVSIMHGKTNVGALFFTLTQEDDFNRADGLLKEFFYGGISNNETVKFR